MLNINILSINKKFCLNISIGTILFMLFVQTFSEVKMTLITIDTFDNISYKNK